MSSDEEEIFFVSSQTSFTNKNKKSNMTSLISENFSGNKDNNLFGFIKELAIKNDLPLPNKEKDFGVLNTKKFNLEQTSCENDIYKEKINRNVLNDIFKILSKYSN